MSASPKSRANSIPVHLVPNDRYFLHHYDIPEEISLKHVFDHIELVLESISPFPVEQLHWGFLLDAPRRQALLFALYKDNLHDDFKPLFLEDDVFLAAPFAFMLPELEEAPQVRIYFYADHWIASYYSGKNTFASDYICFPASTVSPSQLNKKLTDFCAKYHLRLPNFYKTLDEVVLTPSQDLYATTYSHGWDELDSEPQVEYQFFPYGEVAFYANMADSFDIPTQVKQYRSSLVVGKFIKGTAAALALLLVAQVLLTLYQTKVNVQKNLVDKRVDRVIAIEEKDTLAGKIDWVQGRFLSPLNILSHINQVRPRGVYFRSSKVDQKDGIRIEGAARSVDEANQFIDSLTASPLFTNVDVKNLVSQGGQVNFSIQIAPNA